MALSLFKSKTVVERYEEEFKIEEMRRRHIFYDMYVRVGDPEELGSYAAELLQDMDFKSVINEMTKYEEMDVEGVFTGGRLKPVRRILKSMKLLKKGPKYPIVWKIFSLIGIVLFAYYVWQMLTTQLQQTNLLFYAVGSIIFSFLIYMIKETVQMAAWVKIAGIYNIQDEQADVRVSIAGDSEKRDREAFTKLEEDLAEFYNVLTKRYIKKRVGKPEVVIQEIKGEEEPDVRVMKSLKDIGAELHNLDKRLSEGKISEETYKQVRTNLSGRKDRLQTILDLFSV